MKVLGGGTCEVAGGPPGDTEPLEEGCCHLHCDRLSNVLRTTQVQLSDQGQVQGPLCPPPTIALLSRADISAP